MTKRGAYVAKDPRYKKASTMTARERLELNIGARDDCWLWTGTINSTTGYGVVQHDGTKWLAHRFAYELLVGPIPEGLTIDHLCSVRNCVCPAHLEPVTREENGRRGEKNRKTRSSGARPWRRSHCKYGHELAGDNLYMFDGDKQRCRQCARDRMSKFKARRAAA